MSLVRCKKCNDEFENEDALLKHVKVTHGDHYTCGICFKQFQIKGSYMDHMKSHTNNEVMYECTECPCFFKNPGHLQTHIREVHSNEKVAHECKKCKKLFNTKALLNQHERRVHPSVLVVHKCHLCERVYSSSNSLQCHIKINHNKNFKRSICPYCPSDFKWPHHLKMHIKKAHIQKGHAPSDLIKNGLSSIRRKSNACIVCHTKFDRKLDLLLHLRKEHNQDLDIFKCCICSAAFSLKNSLRLHLDVHRKAKVEIEHKCEQCYPEPNPQLYVTEPLNEGTEIEKEIIDFELTLMEDEDIRRLIKYRIKHARRNKENNYLQIKYNDCYLDDIESPLEDIQSDIAKSDSTLSDNDDCQVNGDNILLSENDGKSDEDKKKYSIDKEIKIFLERVQSENKGYKNQDVLEKESNSSKNDNGNISSVDIQSNVDKETTSNKCSICNIIFHKPVHLSRHLKVKHRVPNSKDKLRSNIKDQYQYESHKKSTSKHSKVVKNKILKRNATRSVKPKVMKCLVTRLHECGQCEMFFETKLELLRHISNIHFLLKPKSIEN